jgi:hypothetical protein
MVDSFTYLGVTVHCRRPFGPEAAATRGKLGEKALYHMFRKCAELGLQHFPTRGDCSRPCSSLRFPMVLRCGPFLLVAENC